MALEEARAYLESKGYGDRIQIFDVSSATVELTSDELEQLSGSKEWIDVCKIPEKESDQ